MAVEYFKKSVICPYTNKEIPSNKFKTHVRHKLKSSIYSDFILFNIYCDFLIRTGISKKIKEQFITDIFKKRDKQEIVYIKRFNHFNKLLNQHRVMVKADFPRFWNEFNEFKIKKSKATNCIELCKIVYDTEELALNIYERTMKSKNPYTNHGGKLSPHSDKFIKYEGLTEADISIKKEEMSKKNSEGRLNGRPSSNKIEYWLNKGYTSSEAEKKLKERQSTNSIKSIMERNKCSIEDATEIRKEITEKWVNNFSRRGGYSIVSQDLFWRLYKEVNDKNLTWYFATNDNGYRNETVNKEYRVKTKNTVRLLDCYIPEINLNIEFDGTYWHGNVGRGNRTRDDIRDNEITESIPGLEIVHVSENEFYENGDKVINNLIKIIKNKTKHLSPYGN